MTVRVAVSFEVYPPRSPDKLPGLQESIKALDSVAPEFISVTFGAGGSSTRNSLDVLSFIKDKTAAKPLAHLTCVGTTRTEAEGLIASFLDHGITEFLALRGDLPEGETEHRGELHHAVDLVDLMKNGTPQSQPIERIAVAAFPNGHPESASLDQDIETLLAKQNAGATLAITQLFFYVEDYVSFVERATDTGVTIPILPGLMPITSPRPSGSSAGAHRGEKSSGARATTPVDRRPPGASVTRHRVVFGDDSRARGCRRPRHPSLCVQPARNGTLSPRAGRGQINHEGHVDTSHACSL